MTERDISGNEDRVLADASMEPRLGDWIQTFTGKAFWPVDPRPDEIHIEDIAHALSLLCRYNGHCIRFYSVAEHSVYVSRAVPQEHRMTALLHDASEAYLADVPRPVKASLKGYADIERGLERVIARRFSLSFPFPDAVKEADYRVFADEKAQIMAPEPMPWKVPFPALGIEIVGLPPAEAKALFLSEYAALSQGANAPVPIVTTPDINKQSGER